MRRFFLYWVIWTLLVLVASAVHYAVLSVGGSA